MEEEEGEGSPLRGVPAENVRVWGMMCPPLEENRSLPEFTPEHVHLLLRGVYRDFLHHNVRLHVDGGVLENSVRQSRWCRLATQSARWYDTPAGSVGCWFMVILATGWQGVLDRSCNSEIPLVFAHVIFKKTLEKLRAREI